MRRGFILPVGAMSGPLFLDGRADVAAAYSFRRVRSAYAGALVRVRRSSDSTEQDFGAALPAVNWAAVLAFIGAGNGFVTTWYDQGGNTRDLLQATASAQPQIGLLANGLPGMTFDGVNDQLVTAGFTLNQAWAFNLVYRLVADTQTVNECVFDAITGDQGVLFRKVEALNGGPYNNAMYAGALGPTSDNGVSMPVATRGVVGGTFNNASSLMEVNAATIASFTGTTGANNMDGLRLGNSITAAGRFANVEVQEWPVFNAAHTSTQLKADNASMRSAWGF